MSKTIPPISKYMTAMPHSIEPHQPLESAKKKMLELGIRHLPVLSGNVIVGLLTERDVNLLATFSDVNFHKACVADAMLPEPYCVDPETRIDDVAKEMADNRYGSVLVVQGNGKLVGIFTYIDALRCLAELFDTRLKKS